MTSLRCGRSYFVLKLKKSSFSALMTDIGSVNETNRLLAIGYGVAIDDAFK